MEGSTIDQRRTKKRTKVLEANGYRVLRYWNNDVLLNIDGVLEDILSAITTTPTPNPLPEWGEGVHRVCRGPTARAGAELDFTQAAEEPVLRQDEETKGGAP
jgi:hypothetical protein